MTADSLSASAYVSSRCPPAMTGAMECNPRDEDKWLVSSKSSGSSIGGSKATVSFEDTTANASRHTVGILTESLNYVDAEIVAIILAPGVHRRGEVRGRTDLMEAAHRAGQAAVQS